MTQGSFEFQIVAVDTINFTNDNGLIFLGGIPFTGNGSSEPDYTQVTTDWIVGGTGGTGKLLSITLQTDPQYTDRRSVLLLLQTGGGTFTAGGYYTLTPPSVPCFAEGTRILTNTGYKAIENIRYSDRVITCDNRAIEFGLLRTKIAKTTSQTAPYLIQPGAFGKNKPSAPIRLSGLHKIQIRKGIWTSPEKAVITNPLVSQCAVGEPITYYHIECKNYLADNLITEGLVVESFGSAKSTDGFSDIYRWSEKLGGYTRIGNGSLPMNLK